MKWSQGRLAGIAAGVVVLALTGGALLLGGTAGQGEDSETAAAPDAAIGALAASATDAFNTDMPIPVEGVEVVRDTMVLAVRASGEAAAWRSTVVRAQVSGLVRGVPVRENARVSGGGLLVALDPEEHQLALDEAVARLATARAQYEEATLFDGRIQDDAVRAERAAAARARTGLEAAELAVTRAGINVRRTRVAAPFAGVVANMRVVPGQFVNAGDELLTVQETDPIRVEVQVLESEVGYLASGRSASVSFAAFPGRVFAGRIETINPVVEQQTRTARVTVAVRNPSGEILPGMYATVALDARRLADRTMVPRSAILERGERRTMLFVYEGDSDSGRAKWRYVTTGVQNATHVEIVEHPDTDMVQAGEIVLVDGHYTLTHDAVVRLTANVAAAGGRPR
jgi:membrane fusion protein, multidrug efflux system